MACLTLDQIDREVGNVDASSSASLHLSHRALADVSCLASFKNLEKLDLSFNCLSNLEGLSVCVNLKWLSLVENKLESLKGIERLSKLTVFNAGKNKLRSMEEVSSVISLRALILNDNKISSICKLDKLQYLNTLVLSKNPIYEIGDSLMKAKSLTKLSLSHCHLEKIGSSLTSCVELKELRLAHNKITTIPAELARNTRLQNLDMGNNLIGSLKELKVLAALPHLKNLNFQGNPIEDKDKLTKTVKRLVPNLRIFNAKPVDASKKGKMFSGQDTLSKHEPSLHNASDIEADKDVKRKKSKKDAKTFESNVTKRSSEEVLMLSGLCHDEVGKGKKRKKSEKGIVKRSKLEQKKDDVADATNLKTSWKAERTDVENREVPFMEEALCSDPVLDDTTSGNVERKKDQKVVHDERQAASFTGLVIEHKRKKKTKSAHFSLQLLTPNSEVGLGGTSTWDD